MNIIEKTYKWNGSLIKRNKTQYIILHHRAGYGDADSIHAQHLSQSWSGIGYHFYIRRDGNIYTGRPVDTIGAHCTDYNLMSVGVCFEGNFETDNMTQAQIDAGRELVNYLKKLYPGATVKKHKDFSATACPGKNFPFEKITEPIITQPLTAPRAIIEELMSGELKVPISEVDRAVKALEKAKKEQSSLYWILYKIVNKVVE